MHYMLIYLSDNDKNILGKKEIIKKGLIFVIKYVSIFGILNIIIAHIALRYFGLDFISKSRGLMDVSSANNILMYVIVIIFFTPFLEETLYRLWLTLNRYMICLSAFVFSYYLLTIIHSISFNEYAVDIVYKLSISFAISVIPLLISKNKYFYVKNKCMYRYLILLSVILFALSHVFKYYGNSMSLFPIYILLCLPQFFLGIAFTYYRLNLGFWYGVAFHCLWNGVLNIVPIYYMYQHLH